MFTSQISIKAWAIYREICPKKEQELSQDKEAKALERRNYFSQAVKASYEYFKAIKKGVVKFIKILDLFTGEAEIQERKVMSLEDYDYEKKTDRVTKASQFVFIDLEKAMVGKVREFISFNVSQLIW
jgi:hypothetical protein